MWHRNRKTGRRGKYQKYCLHLASFQNVDSCKTDVVNLILFFFSSLAVCKRKALGFSLFRTKYNNSFNGKTLIVSLNQNWSLSQMWIYVDDWCISHPIHCLFPSNGSGRVGLGGFAKEYSCYYTFVTLPHSLACLFYDAILNERCR